MMLALSGCDAPVEAKMVAQSRPESISINTRTSTANEASWNAGVILAGRSSYQCVSLEAVGLTPSDKVVSITSSCDCISASLVAYATSESSQSSGILLQFVDETTTHHNDASSLRFLPPAKLRVVFEATLADGNSCKFAVDFLKTHLVERTSAEKEQAQ